MSRLSKGAKNAIAFFIATVLIGIGYYFFIQITGLSIPCFFRSLTGYQCAGCGLTRMFINLFHFRFREAFECNQVVFFLWPFVGVELLYVVYLGGNNKDVPKWNLTLIYIVFAIMIVFGIIRNIGVKV